MASSIDLQLVNCHKQHLELVNQNGCTSTWVKNLVVLIFICIIFCIILGFLLYSLVDHIRSSRRWKEHEAKRVRKKPIRRISYPITLDHNPYTVDVLIVCCTYQRYDPSHNHSQDAILPSLLLFRPLCLSTYASRGHCSSRYPLAHQNDVSTSERRNVNSSEYRRQHDI